MHLVLCTCELLLNPQYLFDLVVSSFRLSLIHNVLVVGLQLKLDSYIKLSLLGLLSTTVLAGPTYHSSLKTITLASVSFVAQPIISLFLRRLK